MKLEKLTRSPKFDILEEDTAAIVKANKFGTPVLLDREGKPKVMHSVIFKPTGMCVAGNLHLEEDGGKDKIWLFKTGCLIQKAQQNLVKPDTTFYEHTFVDAKDGTILFILQDLDNEFLNANNNGKFSFSFSNTGVTITKRLLNDDRLRREFSYRELGLGNPGIIFDNNDFYKQTKETQSMS